MNLLKLQEILGSIVTDITDITKNEDEHKKVLINAEYTAKIAKQMINNADIVLRSEKLMHEGYEMNSTRELIGEH